MDRECWQDYQEYLGAKRDETAVIALELEYMDHSVGCYNRKACYR